MHLGHEYVRVIPRISDDRSSLAVTQHVISIRPGQQLCRIASLKEVRVANRSVAIKRLKIQSR